MLVLLKHQFGFRSIWNLITDVNCGTNYIDRWI